MQCFNTTSSTSWYGSGSFSAVLHIKQFRNLRCCWHCNGSVMLHFDSHLGHNHAPIGAAVRPTQEGETTGWCIQCCRTTTSVQILPDCTGNTARQFRGWPGLLKDSERMKHINTFLRASAMLFLLFFHVLERFGSSPLQRPNFRYSVKIPAKERRYLKVIRGIVALIPRPISGVGGRAFNWLVH